MTQRLWWALLLTVGFGGARVAEALGVGSTGSRLIAGVAFALSPRVLTTLGSISSETLPMMLAPWVLLPVILALRGRPGQRPCGGWPHGRRVAVALMGAVNAVATLTGCLAAVTGVVAVSPAEPVVVAVHRVVALGTVLAVRGGWSRWCCSAGSARRFWTSSNRQA